MADTPKAPEPFSLSLWSRRKLDAARAPPVAPATEAVVAPTDTAVVVPPVPAADIAPEARALPPVESLTIDSDFSAFMQPKVDEDVKRAALRKLFSDPQFNVMDGLDIYIGDYTQSDPMPAGMLEKLASVYGVLTEDGEDEKVEAPNDVVAAAAPAALPQAAAATLADDAAPASAAEPATHPESGPAVVPGGKQA